MTVNSVWIDGFMQTYDPKTGKINTASNKSGVSSPRLSLEQGSAVESSPGLFLTAGHVLAGPFSVTNNDGTVSIYKALPQASTYKIKAKVQDQDSATWYNRAISGGISINNINLLGYSQSIGISSQGAASDLASFQSTPQGSGTGIIAFNSPTVQQINDYFPNLSFTGYPAVQPSTSLSVPTATPSGNRTIQSVAAPGIFQISGPADGGVSGSGVTGISQKSGQTYGNTYIVGTVEGQYGVNRATASTLVNYMSEAKLWYLFANYTPPAGVDPSKLPRNEIVGNSNGNDQISGVNAPENIIANGGSNKILGGSYGDVINPGNGLGNEVFIPSKDAGTTVVVTPGSTTIVGGTSQDRLAVLSDRLWNSSTGVPSSSNMSNISNTIPLLGGFYNAQIDTGPVPSDAQFTTQNSIAAQQGSADPSTWEIGNYDLSADYQFNGTDLKISVIARNPTVQSDPIMWRSNIDLVNYKLGEFGLSFKDWNLPAPNWSDPQGTALAKYTAIQNDELSMMAAPQAQSDLNDDANNVWNYTSMQPITPPSQAQLNSDLQSLQNLYSTSGTSAVATSAIAKSAVTTTSLYTSDLEQKSTDSSSNVFYGSPANNILTGNEKSDVFIFGPASGKDTVTNFKTGGFNHDLIQFDHSIFANASSALAASTQIGNDVLISISGNNSILLENTHLNKLSTSEFRIV